LGRSHTKDQIKNKPKDNTNPAAAGFVLADQKTSPKAFRRAKCVFPHTNSPLHGRKSGLPEMANEDNGTVTSCISGQRRLPQGWGNTGSFAKKAGCAPAFYAFAVCRQPLCKRSCSV
jgi:hypothetical protein